MMSRAYELMEGVDAEVSLEAGLSTVLRDQTFSDVTLVANDGIKVPAHRVILCARSKVFKTMLTGSFSENSSPTIEVDFPGAVVNAVVEHIYTNEVKLLKNVPAKVDEFQVLVSLTAAAAYYNLPKLCHRVNSCMQDCVTRMPSLSFAVMEACAQEGPAISKDVFQAALSIIYQKLDVERSSESLNEDVLCSLSASVLGQVLRDEDPPFLVQEYKRFQMVELWSKKESDRQDAAKAMVKEHIKLHWIKPLDLAASVAPSGLTDLAQLAEAYMVQSMNAQNRLPFGKYLSNPIWCGSNSEAFAPKAARKSDMMKCRPLCVGRKYHWIIKVGTGSGNGSIYAFIGVALSYATIDFDKECSSNNSCFGMLVIGNRWSKYQRGEIWSNEDQFSAHEGSFSHRGPYNVQVTLDLSAGEARNGCLLTSVEEGQAAVSIIGNMRNPPKVPYCSRSMGAPRATEASEGQTCEYIPVVSCGVQSSATIVCFTEELQ